MIRTKKELSFYIKADYMMNRGYFSPSWKRRLFTLIFPDYIMDYLCAMRKYHYYKHLDGGGKILSLWYKMRFRKLGIKLGYSIHEDVIGYGLVLCHHGTIVVGGENHIGNYCVLHTSTCVAQIGKEIGDGCYLSTGVKITKSLKLGDNVSIGANSLVNSSYPEGNIMIAGSPAKVIKTEQAWYFRDGEPYNLRVEAVEALRKEFGL